MAGEQRVDLGRVEMTANFQREGDLFHGNPVGGDDRPGAVEACAETVFDRREHCPVPDQQVGRALGPGYRRQSAWRVKTADPRAFRDLVP